MPKTDVFLSFNYEETGKKFSDHLHSAISGAGHRTFIAGNKAHLLDPETIKKEIEKSKVSVVVFSKDFAWSPRCLEEVVMLMEARSKSGLIVLPIFYHAQASELRWLKGRYGEALAEHEMRYPEEIERVDRWKAALAEVSYLQGMVLRGNMIFILERREYDRTIPNFRFIGSVDEKGGSKGSGELLEAAKLTEESVSQSIIVQPLSGQSERWLAHFVDFSIC